MNHKSNDCWKACDIKFVSEACLHAPIFLFFFFIFFSKTLMLLFFSHAGVTVLLVVCDAVVYTLFSCDTVVRTCISHISFSCLSFPPHSVGVGLAAESDCDRVQNFCVCSWTAAWWVQTLSLFVCTLQGTGLDRDLAKRYPVLL